MANDKPAGADQATLFAAEAQKCTQKNSVVSGQVLQVSLKEFADMVIEDGAPFNYKW